MSDAVCQFKIETKLPFAVSRHHQESLTFHLAEGVWATIFAVDAEPGITNSGVPMLSATETHTVPDAWLRVLKGISRGDWPDGFRANEPDLLLFDFYPADMQAFCASVADSLTRHWMEAYALIRWRWSSAVDPGSLATPDGPLLWSDDGEEWNRLRLRPQWSARLHPQLSLNPAVEQELEALAATDVREPVGREIWHVASQVDPVTTIILVVTAVEVELKRLLSALVPEAGWLVINLPAPPIVRIIEEYLPKLEGYDQTLSPRRALIGTLKKAVKLRNDFVHVGPLGDASWLHSRLKAETVREVLAATSDLLWLFDAQRGHSWALDNLSDQTSFDLGLRSDSVPEPAGERTFVVPRDQGT